MRYKLLTAGLLAIGALLCVSGCANQSSQESGAESSGPAPVSDTAVTTTATTTTTEVTTTTTEPAWAKLPQVQTMDALAFKGQVTAVYDAYNGRAAVLCYESNTTHSHYIDWVTGKELADIALDRDTYDVIAVTSDEKLITTRSVRGEMELCYYDLSTGEQTSVPFLDYMGQFYFDSTTDQLYTLLDDGVYKVTPEGKPEKHIAGSLGIIYNAMSDPDVGTVYIPQASNDDYTGTDYVGYQLSDCKEILRIPGIESAVRYCGNYLLDLEFRYLDDSAKSLTNCFVLDRDSGRTIRSYLINRNGMPSLHTSSLTNSAIQGEVDDTDSNIHVIRVCNPGSGTYVDLDLNLESVRNMYAVYLRDSGRWLVSYTSYGSNGSTPVSSVFSVDPSRMRLTEHYPDADPIAMPEDRTALPPLGADYAENRKKADQIEKDFGVRILIGNEVLRSRNSEYRMVSTEEVPAEEDYYYSDDMQKELSNGLDFLREQLARYPKGFIDKFKASNGKGGLRFSITRNLPPIDESRSFSAGGLQYQNGSWYEIAFNLYMMSGNGATLHHEIWHAAEDLMADNGIPFDYEYWNKLNPPGFWFDGVDHYGEDSEKYQYILLFSSDPYFVESYSTATEMEDRSTICQCIFTPVEEWDDIPYPTNYEYLMSFPHLRAKVNYMESLLQKFYGYVYWKEIPGLTHAE